jgi:hypothetical protein
MLKTRDQALVFTGLLLDRDETTGLLAFLPPDRAAELRTELQRLLEMPAKKRITLALERLKILMDPAFHETIEEIHPAWLGRFLGEEPVCLAGLVLKSLPQRYVPLVLKEMKPDAANRLLEEIKGLAPSPRLAELLQTLLARRFRLPNRMAGIGADHFEIIFFLNCDELAVLLEEIGTCELAMACQRLSEADATAICSKLPAKMRERVQIKLAQYQDTPEERVIQARQSFLHLQDELYQKGKLIEFTGMQLLARALAGEESERLAYLAFKLPPADGDVLVRLVRRLGPPVEPAERQAIRLEILRKITYLAEIDRIRSMWKYY